MFSPEFLKSLHNFCYAKLYARGLGDYLRRELEHTFLGFKINYKVIFTSMLQLRIYCDKELAENVIRVILVYAKQFIIDEEVTFSRINKKVRF